MAEKPASEPRGRHGLIPKPVPQMKTELRHMLEIHSNDLMADIDQVASLSDHKFEHVLAVGQCGRPNPGTQPPIRLLEQAGTGGLSF